PVAEAERPARDPAERRLQTEEPRVARGDADGAAAVGAGRERDETAGDRRRRAAARPARRALEVPRVARDPEQAVLRERGVAELRRVRLPDGDRAGAPEARDLGRVVPRDVGAERDGAVRRRKTGEIFQILHAEGQPGERSGIL